MQLKPPNSNRPCYMPGRNKWIIHVFSPVLKHAQTIAYEISGHDMLNYGLRNRLCLCHLNTNL